MPITIIRYRFASIRCIKKNWYFSLGPTCLSSPASRFFFPPQECAYLGRRNANQQSQEYPCLGIHYFTTKITYTQCKKREAFKNYNSHTVKRTMQHIIEISESTPGSFLMVEAGVVKTFLDHLKCQQTESINCFLFFLHTSFRSPKRNKFPFFFFFFKKVKFSFLVNECLSHLAQFNYILNQRANIHLSILQVFQHCYMNLLQFSKNNQFSYQ